MKKNLILLILLTAFSFFAQNNKTCLEEVLEFEKINNEKYDTTLTNKNIYLSYTVKVTNWDDESTISNVKIYKMGENLHFFSEQANMYISEQEIIVDMPEQKVLILNNGSKDIKGRKLSDDFFEMRKHFLDSCRVIKCENTGKSTKILVLKVDSKEHEEAFKISDMTYEYDVDLKKIMSITVNYNSDYKIKTMTMIYKDYNVESDYKFTSVKAKFIDKGGNLIGKYKTYELVDNRDNVKSKNKNQK